MAHKMSDDNLSYLRTAFEVGWAHTAHAPANTVDLCMLLTMTSAIYRAYALCALQVFDTDRNGFISSEELCRVLSGVGEPVTHAEVQRVIVDINRGRPTPAAARELGEQNEVLTYEE